MNIWSLQNSAASASLPGNGAEGESELKIAISPCPNDTFAFYSLIHESRYTFDFLDIEELNRALLMRRYAVAKGSFALMKKLADDYEILPAGAAIGKGVGPVLVGQVKPGALIALPGENTTAHKLFHFWLSKQAGLDIAVKQMPFFEMLPALQAGSIDAAVLIHEGRFVYPGLGLSLVSDLGAFWEEHTNAMIPLGCIYALKSLAETEKAALVHALQVSIERSRAAYREKSPLYTEHLLPYMRTMAQEKDDAVVAAHVDTYVTSDTFDLGQSAKNSISIFSSLLV